MIPYQYKKIGIAVVILSIVTYGILSYLNKIEWLRFAIWGIAIGIQVYIISKEKNEQENPKIAIEKYRIFFENTHFAIILFFIIKLLSYIFVGIPKNESQEWQTIVIMIFVIFLLQFRKKNR
jgi:hypothetical protein